jgi:RNA polymerase sigma-70 factor (ECF subfamily)
VIDPALADRLYGLAHAQRWNLGKDRFAEALEASVARAFAGQTPKPRDVERYLTGLHLDDLALASACDAGDSGAWDYFVLEQRPLLYRAADALDPGGGARDLADSLYAELFGLRERDGKRQSLFRYFHGRSSLTTWLRAVLAQRYVDRFRARRRVEALPDDESPDALAAPQKPVDPDRHRYLEMIGQAVTRAVRALLPRDRLRLACYYAEEMTLAETATIVGEHEATSSRQLTKTRRAIRVAVESQLRSDEKLTDAQIAQCFASVADDAGPLDLQQILEADLDRKKSTVQRSR